ncbi:MAG: hypothetical protein IPN29_05205 [Saprospiraceae bacterium]|nr:hypothetical protein [Saprospiraceae bacterium]
MIKFILIAVLLAYVFRRVLFVPLNEPKTKKQAEKPKEEKPRGFTNKVGDYTDYEEIK